jgi:hypothetical protein
MKGGIKFNLTCLISQEELTEQTILKRLGKYVLIKLNRVQIHANCRIRRIYFSDRLYTEDELPPEFKLFLPVAGKTQAQ